MDRDSDKTVENGYYWTPEDDALILSDKTSSGPQLARRLFPGRSVAAVQTRRTMLLKKLSPEERAHYPSQRGFASMNPERQKEIASAGGIAAHKKGTAHQFTSEEAEQAGKMGGLATSADREHMRLIAKEGGKARRKKFAEQANEPNMKAE